MNTPNKPSSVSAAGNASSPARTRTFTWEDPTVHVKAALASSGLEIMRAAASGKTPPPPISSLVGMAIETVEEGRVVFTLTPAEYQYNPLGTVHGGIIATVLDSALGCCIHTTLPAGKTYTTLEIKINYVAAVTEATGLLRCDGRVVHRGGRVATSEARLVDAKGKLYAHGTSTCIIMDIPARPTGEVKAG